MDVFKIKKKVKHCKFLSNTEKNFFSRLNINSV